MMLRVFNPRNINPFKSVLNNCRFQSSYQVTQYEDYLSIQSSNFKTEVTFNWLRDHCRSEKCYDKRTNQRLMDITDLTDITTKPTNIHYGPKTFQIIWDDGHTSDYDFEWIKENSKNYLGKASDPTNISISKILWDKNIIADNQEKTFVNYDHYMNTIDGIKDAVKSLLTYGFVIIKQVPEINTDKGTLPTVSRMFKLADNLYGKSYEFTSNHQGSFSDTAYTDLALGTHTDLTYSTEASGLQVFHILKEADVGGDSLLADGFHIAKCYKNKNMEGYRFLSEFPVESEYIHNYSEPREHYFNSDFVFKHSPYDPDEIIQFRYNVYDRAPHKRMNLDQQRKFYRYYRDLASNHVNNPDNIHRLKLTPGSVLIFDNFRLMHGRTQFKGERTMSGCYVDRANFLSRARVILNS